MNADELQQRRKGAQMIIERCKKFARELGVDLKRVEWKEDISDAKDVYTLVVHTGSEPDEIPLDHNELQAYPAKTSTTGTDEKLKSAIQKRPSGY